MTDIATNTLSNATLDSGALPDLAFSDDLSIMALILRADIVVKTVMVLLFLSSFWCWAIIFDKLATFRRLRVKTRDFEKLFWSGQLLDQLYDRIKDRVDHPMASVFAAAMNERNRHADEKPGKGSNIRAGVKERTFQAMQVAQNRGLEKVESNLGFLATVGSSAPFLGLFGTVWGIMNSFQSIAVSKNTTLAVVAPGIAEALLATAIGLFAAIPAVIFYNLFANKLNHYVIRLEDFSSELGSMLSRELDAQEK